MQSLIILAHPESDPIGAAIAQEVEAELRGLGAPVRIHDLYRMRFQPALAASDFEAWARGEQPAELQPLQVDITWAELLILVYPTKWGGTPAMLKGYIDRVLAMGFAYGVREGKMGGFLEGKRALLLSTTEGEGGPVLSDSLKRVMGAATLAFCGVTIEAEVAIEPAGLSQVRQRVRELVTRRPPTER